MSRLSQQATQANWPSRGCEVVEYDPSSPCMHPVSRLLGDKGKNMQGLTPNPQGCVAMCKMERQGKSITSQPQSQSRCTHIGSSVHSSTHKQAPPGPDHTSITSKITGSTSSPSSLAQGLPQHGGRAQGTCPPLANTLGGRKQQGQRSCRHASVRSHPHTPPTAPQSESPRGTAPKRQQSLQQK